MDLADVSERARRIFPPTSASLPHKSFPLEGLTLLRDPRATSFETSIYDPVFCLIVEGSKQTTTAGKTLTAKPGEGLLVSHDVPVVSRVVRAPYLALILALDLELLRSLRDDVEDATPESYTARALEVHRVEPALIDALGRLLALAETPRDRAVLGPLVVREIHYRLLAAPVGAMLRRMLWKGSNESAVARAIARIRKDYKTALSIPELAHESGMSPASFHKHFKAVTQSSPLQYQKELRLLDAKRLLASGTASVSSVAFDVGYESPSQFSREYARRFGAPPSRDAFGSTA
jgi:AraC-like DNA-binding protein